MMINYDQYCLKRDFFMIQKYKRNAPLTVELFHRHLPALLGPAVDGQITPWLT